jgi:S1-C subfamily serine protease
MKIKRKIAYFIFILFLGIETTDARLQEKSYCKINDDLKLASILSKAKLSVVSIHAYIKEKDNKECRIGSGFIYSQDGFIITKNGVVQGSDSIVVTTVDGYSEKVRVVYRDPSTKVVVLKLSDCHVTPMPCKNSSVLDISPRIIIMGNSLGIFPSITLGNYINTRSDGLKELDILIPPGNCGSPVLNEEGYLVGIILGISNICQSNNRLENKIGIMLPIEKVSDVIDKALKFEDGKGWIGISVVDLNGFMFKKGVMVVDIVPGGPAERAKICKGDTIVGFEGHAIHGARELAQWVQQMSPNSQIKFSIRKGKKNIYCPVKIDKYPSGKL